MHRSTSSRILLSTSGCGNRRPSPFCADLLFEAIERLVLRCVLRFLLISARIRRPGHTMALKRINKVGVSVDGREGEEIGGGGRPSLPSLLIHFSLKRRVGTAFMWRHLRTQHNYFPFKAFEAVCHLRVR